MIFMFVVVKVVVKEWDILGSFVLVIFLYMGNGFIEKLFCGIMDFGVGKVVLVNLIVLLVDEYKVKGYK